MTRFDPQVAERQTMPTAMELKMIRFCAICGEREDSPFLTLWCDDWSYTEQPRGSHVWGHPKKVWDRD